MRNQEATSRALLLINARNGRVPVSFTQVVNYPLADLEAPAQKKK